MSRLCLFLAGPSGWDRTAGPELAGLLGDAGIAAHLDRLRAAGKAGKTRENHRADLRRLARAVAGLPARQPAAPRPAPPVRVGSGELFGARSRPLTALPVAWAQRSGRLLRREDLDPVVASLAGRDAGVCIDWATRRHGRLGCRRLGGSG